MMRDRAVAALTACLVASACDIADLTSPLPVRPDAPARALEGVTLRSIDVEQGRWRMCGVDEFGAVHCVPAPFHGTANEVFQAAEPFERVSVGFAFACALDADGGAWCWGEGFTGALGNGERLFSPVPVRVEGPAFVELEAEGSTACGVTAENQLYCWGFHLSDEELPGCATCVVSDSVPTLVQPQLAVVDIALGDSYMCALTVDGEVACWGANNAGQLGTGDFTSKSQPTAVELSAEISAVVAGAAHTCALGTDGAAWCWGSNRSGELGSGENLFDSPIPRRVAGDHVFTILAATLAATCALDDNGAAWCWGSNSQHAITWDDVPVYDVPKRIPNAPPFVDIATVPSHTCAIDAEGQGYCWGDGSI